MQDAHSSRNVTKLSGSSPKAPMLTVYGETALWNIHVVNAFFYVHKVGW